MITSTEPIQKSVPTADGKPACRCYTIADLQDILRISRSSVHSLLEKNEFRWFKVGRCYRISKESFDEWLDRISTDTQVSE